MTLSTTTLYAECGVFIVILSVVVLSVVMLTVVMQGVIMLTVVVPSKLFDIFFLHSLTFSLNLALKS